MNCEEVKISLHDFVDDELDGFQRNECEAHLRTCDKCYNEYKSVKRFFNILKELPSTIEPPGDIIDNFASELLIRRLQEDQPEAIQSASELKKLRRERDKQEKQIKKIKGSSRNLKISKQMSVSGIGSSFFVRSVSWGKILWLLLPIVLLLAGYFIYDFQKYNSPWKVITNSGTVAINGLFNHSGKISQGASLVTKESSKATVYVPKVGSIIADQNSLLILVKTKDGSNIIRLESGTINVINTSAMPDLRIELKNYSVVDRGGDFIIEADIRENAKVSVRYGLVEIKNGNRTIYLVDGYSCEIRNGLGIGTPYRENASPEFKDEVKNFDSGNRNSTQKIIELAESNDALTLLGMIPRADQSQREMLFQTVAGWFRPPEGVTRAGILKADDQMIFLWWQEIEWQL